jgi:Sec-independent protein translocase protein TatA
MGLPGFPLGGGGGFLNVGTPELVVIGGLAWLLLGPKELLRLSREAGVLIGNLRKLGTEAADQFRDAIESELALDEIEQEKKAIETSMAEMRAGKAAATPADDAFGSLTEADVGGEPTPKK